MMEMITVVMMVGFSSLVMRVGFYGLVYAGGMGGMWTYAVYVACN